MPLNPPRLKEFAAETQADLQHLPIAVLQVTPDGRLLNANREFQRLLGYSAEELESLSFSSVFTFLDQEQQAADHRALLKHSIASYACEALAKSKDGGELPVKLSATAPEVRDRMELERVIVIVEDRTELRNAREALRNSEDARHEMARRLTHAQESERARIARELHDDICQSLAILRIQFLRAGQPVSGMPGKRHASVTDLCNDLRDLASKVSRLSHRLHSSELEYLGLSAAVQSHCREFSEKYKIPVTCSCKDIPTGIEGLLALSLLRVVQESLHNAAKHSQAKEIQVVLKLEDGEIFLSICDDGVGFDLEQVRLAAGLGLISMRERIHLAGGRFEITSRPGQGTCITARTPVLLASGSSEAVNSSTP